MFDKLKLEIKYVKRARRATIRVMPQSVVKVTVPFGVKETEIKKWVESKSKWILEKHELIEKNHNERKIDFVSGELLPFYGGVICLKTFEGHGQPLEKDSFLLVPVPKRIIDKESYIKSLVIKWYKAQALEKIESRVSHYCNLLGVKPKSISIKNYKSRWGACNSKGDLIFNWQIITLNQNLFDYVIAHEICHLKEMNHSPKFYQLLVRLGFDKSEVHKQMRYLRNII